MFNLASYAYGVYPSLGRYGMTGTHELGHMMGIYHTHTLADIYDECSNECFEHQPAGSTDESSMTTGDLCADTRPTTRNYCCADPNCGNGCSEEPCTDCDADDWVNTPYRNAMGYANDACMVGASHGVNGQGLTLQQGARARCYADWAYATWMTENSCPEVVTAPEIASWNDGYYLTWHAPIRPANGALSYTVTRDPPFASADPVTSNEWYNDDTANNYTTYSYRVTPSDSTGAAPFPSAWAVATGVGGTTDTSSPSTSPTTSPTTTSSAGSSATSSGTSASTSATTTSDSTVSMSGSSSADTSSSSSWSWWWTTTSASDGGDITTSTVDDAASGAVAANELASACVVVTAVAVALANAF